jgi:hypothetical protein
VSLSHHERQRGDRSPGREALPGRPGESPRRGATPPRRRLLPGGDRQPDDCHRAGQDRRQANLLLRHLPRHGVRVGEETADAHREFGKGRDREASAGTSGQAREPCRSRALLLVPGGDSIIRIHHGQGRGPPPLRGGHRGSGAQAGGGARKGRHHLFRRHRQPAHRLSGPRARRALHVLHRRSGQSRSGSQLGHQAGRSVRFPPEVPAAHRSNGTRTSSGWR